MMDWPHAPAHRLVEAGAYMVTAGTYMKHHYFGSQTRLSYLQKQLLTLAELFGWRMQAWAVFSNHYHFIGFSPADPSTLRTLIQRLHSVTAREINRLDGAAGRKVWFQYWDTHLTYQRSYFARLNYVHQNPVHHRLVARASAYPWCSAGWFEQKADAAFYKTVTGFKIDRINVKDDFDVECGGLPPLSKIKSGNTLPHSESLPAAAGKLSHSK